MWVYVKTLQHPINLKCKDLAMAKYLITQYGGPDGELSASLRYLNQRYTMPTGKSKGLLNDIGTEEMAHVEMIATMVYQLMENASIEEIIYHLMKISDVILVGKITKIKEALDIIDMGLALGKEIICIKNSGYVANNLIKDGAIYV